MIREIYNYREMLKNFIQRDLRTRYKESILGFFWTLLNPLLMLIIYTIAFKTILRMDMENYSIFLFSGLLSWNYLQTTVSNNTAIIVNNSGLVKKVYFPYEILPLSTSIAGAINYLLCMIVLLAAMIYFDVKITVAVLSVFIILAIQVIFVFGLSLMLCAINVYFRDVEHIVGVLFMAWFYLTPIFYPLSMVPEKYQHLFYYNPMTYFMEAYQSIFYHGKVPELNLILYCFIVALIILIVGYIVFYLLKRKFAEEL